MQVRFIAFIVAVVGCVAVWAFSCVSKRFEHVAAGVMPLTARDFPKPVLITVGSGGTFENPQRLGPSLVVGWKSEMLLVDAGRGVTEALRAAEIPVQQPGVLLLTGLLPENTLGVDDLLMMRSLTAPDEAPPPLGVWGPPGTRALIEGLLASHRDGIRAQQDGLGTEPRPEIHEIDGDSPFQAAGMSIHPRRLPGDEPASLAYRIEAGGRTLLISSRGSSPETLVEHGRGAHLWAHDALYGEALDAALDLDALQPERLRREATTHTRLEDVGGLAAEMGVRTLVLTRLRPPPVFHFQYTRLVGTSFDGRVVIAEDGTLVEP